MLPGAGAMSRPAPANNPALSPAAAATEVEKCETSGRWCDDRGDDDGDEEVEGGVAAAGAGAGAGDGPKKGSPPPTMSSEGAQDEDDGGGGGGGGGGVGAGAPPPPAMTLGARVGGLMVSGALSHIQMMLRGAVRQPPSQGLDAAAVSPPPPPSGDL